MKHHLFLIFVILIYPVIGMESPAKDKEIESIVREMNDAKKLKHEKLAELIHHEPFPQKVNFSTYLLLQKICKPHYSILLERLLEKRIVNPNTHVTTPQGSKGLLADAIASACKQKENLAAVKVLLHYKADPNQQLCTRSENEDDGELPIVRAILHMPSSGLLDLLLNNGADPNMRKKSGVTPMMDALWSYSNANIKTKLQQYQNIQILLEHGALIDLPSIQPYSSEVSTPRAYASSLGLKDLIDLLNQYPNNTVIKSRKKS